MIAGTEGSLAQAFVPLALLLGFVVLARLGRAISRRREGGQSRALLEIVEARPLGPKARLAVVRVGGRQALFSVTDARVELVSWIEDGESCVEAADDEATREVIQ